MDHDLPEPDIPLGPCCACARTVPEVRIRTIMMLAVKAPHAGRGWGCIKCKLPPDGAVAVLCDDCAPMRVGEKPSRPIRYACRGYPATEGRVPIEELTIPHDHNPRYHPELSKLN